MKVRVKFDYLIGENKDSTAFLISERKIILKKDSFKMGRRKSIIVEQSLATAHNLRWKLLLHIPPAIQPTYNQECIDELRFRPEEGY